MSLLTLALYYMMLTPGLAQGNYDLAALYNSTDILSPEFVRQGATLVKPEQLPLRTNGRYIVDKFGLRVKWACTNWYGAYSTRHVNGGLEYQRIEYIVNAIAKMGFNCVRMMYSTQGYVHNPPVADDSLTANPHLKGKRFLELFDLCIELLTKAGLMVIVNNHNSKSGWCCHYSQDEGLWYVPEYPAEVWLESLLFFTERYKNNPYVVAIDLRNEVHDYEDTALTWGDGDPKTDWALAAVDAGNKVLDVNPDVLIVVMSLCFGADLRAMRQKPCELKYPNRVVYQVHNYLEYQIFENLAALTADWETLRWFFLISMIIVLLTMYGLRVGWRRLQKPTPGIWVIVLSAAGWVCFCASLTIYVSSNILNFATKFCTHGATKDIKPWIISASVVLFLSVCTIGLCLWKIFRGGQNTQPDLGDAVGVVGTPIPRPTPVGSANEDVEDTGKGGPSSTSTSELPAWKCCHPGCSSCKAVKAGTSNEIPWDCGLCCCLQCGVVLVYGLVILLFFYIFCHILPTYWWMEYHLDGLWGFALEDHKPYTAPVWMGEFGNTHRGPYWLNFVRYLSHRDVDWAYWAVNGMKWAEGEIDPSSGDFINYDQPIWKDETFGLLTPDYSRVRDAWKMLDLQAIMASPATWTPDTFPCPPEEHKWCRR